MPHISVTSLNVMLVLLDLKLPGDKYIFLHSLVPCIYCLINIESSEIGSLCGRQSKGCFILLGPSTILELLSRRAVMSSSAFLI